MQLELMEHLALIPGLFLLFVSAFYTSMLLFPAIQRRFPRSHAFYTFSDAGLRRTAVVRDVSLIGLWVCMATTRIVAIVPYYLCINPATIRIVTLGLLLPMGICTIVFLSCTATVARACPPLAPPKAQSHWRTLIATLMLLFVMGSIMLIYSSDNRPHIAFERIQMVSLDDGWAIGNRQQTGALFHYSSGHWNEVALLRVPPLTDIAMVTPNEGWVTTTEDTILHYTAGQWQIVASPVERLNAVAMISADKGWAVGELGEILHYNGDTWTVHRPPSYETFYDMTMVSDDDGWIVGEAGKSGVMLHYQHGQWNTYETLFAAPLRVHKEII